MQELMIFNNGEFGQIRTVVIDNEPYFVGKDVAESLAYKDTSDALKRHVETEDKLTRCFTDSGQRRNMLVINESGLYSLIFGSKLETAKKFKRWVTSEVLPTLRKTGSYEMLKKEKQDKPKRILLSSVNTMVKNVAKYLEKAGVDDLYIAAEIKRLYTDAGYPVNAPLITDKETMPKLYDCTEIAKELGIYSTSGKPHSQAVGAIIKKLHIEDSEIVTTAFSRNGHDDATIQYKPSVFEDVKLWLDENNYPTKIPYIDSKGNQKTCTVAYQEVA